MEEIVAKAKKLAHRVVPERTASICGGGPYHCSNTGPTKECVIVCGPSPSCSVELCEKVRNDSSCAEEYSGENLERCLSSMLNDCLWSCGLRDTPPPTFELVERKKRKRRGRR